MRSYQCAAKVYRNGNLKHPCMFHVYRTSNTFMLQSNCPTYLVWGFEKEEEKTWIRIRKLDKKSGMCLTRCVCNWCAAFKSFCFRTHKNWIQLYKIQAIPHNVRHRSVLGICPLSSVYEYKNIKHSILKTDPVSDNWVCKTLDDAQSPNRKKWC